MFSSIRQMSHLCAKGFDLFVLFVFNFYEFALVFFFLPLQPLIQNIAKQPFAEEMVGPVERGQGSPERGEDTVKQGLEQ
jgi:hypothetical protein